MFPPRLESLTFFGTEACGRQACVEPPGCRPDLICWRAWISLTLAERREPRRPAPYRAVPIWLCDRAATAALASALSMGPIRRGGMRRLQSPSAARLTPCRNSAAADTRMGVIAGEPQARIVAISGPVPRMSMARGAAALQSRQRPTSPRRPAGGGVVLGKIAEPKRSAGPQRVWQSGDWSQSEQFSGWRSLAFLLDSNVRLVCGLSVFGSLNLNRVCVKLGRMHLFFGCAGDDA
jgi:hypothetical protein